MTTQQIAINDQVDTFLQKGLRYALILEKYGKAPEARRVLRITSEIAERKLKAHGIPEALREFWNDKRELIEREVL